MSINSKITNLGAPIAVEVAAVERELRALWKSASARGGEGAVIRACSCNFVVFVRDRLEAESLLPVLARVSEWHPCRSLIACREPDAETGSAKPAPPMCAWISAQCFMPFAGGPQICSEVVTVAAQSGAITDLINTIVSLVIPDLPVFVYWRSFREEDRPSMAHVAQYAHILMVDTHATKDHASGRQYLMELLLNPPAGVAVRDLNWARLNAWRDVVAQFFDRPSARREAYEICEVEIERDIALPGNVPTRTLLFTGWLASRLDWTLVSATRTADRWISIWDSKGGEVIVRFSGHLSGSDEVPGISSITLRTRSGTSIRLMRERGAAHIVAVASGNGPEVTHSVLQDSMDEAALLVRELALSGRDASFQSALAVAHELEKRFGHAPPPEGVA